VRDELELDDPAAAKALIDPVRHRIFGLLRTPRSVPELANELAMPANRLYYHVRRLAECGLVHQVDTRTTGRHNERVFERTAARITFSGDLDLAGESPLRGIVDELERGLRSVEPGDPASVSYHVVTVTPDRARELEDHLRELIVSYDDRSRSASARRFGVLGALSPLPDESA
jgi:DNA-binding transcriptional ArsR family regulator